MYYILSLHPNITLYIHHRRLKYNKTVINIETPDIRSLLPKMDKLKVWVHSSNPDVLVITETWLRKSVLNTDVNISGYKLFWQDRWGSGNLYQGSPSVHSCLHQVRPQTI
jgi:hypothetical protein